MQDAQAARISKFFAALLIVLKFLHNYFDGSTKLLSDLVKFLKISVKSSFCARNYKP